MLMQASSAVSTTLPSGSSSETSRRQTLSAPDTAISRAVSLPARASLAFSPASLASRCFAQSVRAMMSTESHATASSPSRPPRTSSASLPAAAT